MPERLAKPELLAPAGDRDCIRAAIENGADAVYFGLDSGFNARARAKNFPASELPEIMAMSDRILVMREGTIVAEFARGEATQERIATAMMSASEDASGMPRQEQMAG